MERTEQIVEADGVPKPNSKYLKKRSQSNWPLPTLSRLGFFSVMLIYEEKGGGKKKAISEPDSRAVETTNNVYRKMGTTYIKKYIPENHLTKSFLFLMDWSLLQEYE
jgi:hypothetical protein